MRKQPAILGLDDIERAMRRIRPFILRTPLVRSEFLSHLAGTDVLLKLETLQTVGSFKIRGATHAIGRLSEVERRWGIVCCSTGNHGRAVAHAAARFGAPAVVCISSLVPENKAQAIAGLGAKVRRVGLSQDDAQAEADRLVAEEGRTDIPPFDHPDVIAGQGTIGLELLADRPDLETIVVPLSGGGLIGGIATAAKARKPDVRIIGVSMDHGAAMYESVKAGRPVEVEESPSLADSLGGGIGQRNRWTLDTCRRLVDDIILLTEQEIYAGMQSIFRNDRLLTEGAGAVGPAALIAGKLALNGPSAMILSGRNAELEQVLAVAGGHPVRVGASYIGG